MWNYKCILYTPEMNLFGDAMIGQFTHLHSELNGIGRVCQQVFCFSKFGFDKKGQSNCDEAARTPPQ